MAFLLGLTVLLATSECLRWPPRSAFVVECAAADERRDVVGDGDRVLVMRRMPCLWESEQLQRRQLLV